MGLSIWQIAIIAVVALILFGGGGKLVRMMGDMGSGLRAFKKGISEESEKDDSAQKPQIEATPEPEEATQATPAKKKAKKKSKAKKSKAKKSKSKKSGAKKS